MKKIILIMFLLFSVTVNAENKTKKPITVKEKKAYFTSVVVPAVKEVYSELDKQYNEISNNLNNKKYAKKIKKLKTKYKVKTDKELLRALKPHPKSIAIAQAAMESAWITSRFFREANNLFGVWSFNKNEPRIAAQQKRGDR
jgi:Bax protein